MIDRKVSQALFSLGISDWILKKEPVNETEFLENFAKVIGEDSEGVAITSSNPTDFGVTWEEIQTEIEKQESLNYQKLRQTEYPSIGDQLDALFKAGAFPADMAAKIQAVKDKYPKA